MAMRNKTFIKSVLDELELKRNLGVANRCPNCKRTGEFGSIRLFHVGKGFFLCCGWCGKATKMNRKRYRRIL